MKGYSGYEAVQLTKNRLRETQRCLNEKNLEPNCGRDHVYKIIAHAGKHSKNGGPVLKYKLKEFLEENRYEYFSDMDHGIFLIRMRAEY